MKNISFFVPGIPAPGGSKKFVGMSKATGRAILIDAGGKRNKDWRKVVATVGMVEMRDQKVPIFTGPLKVTVQFFMPRPKADCYTDGNVRLNAPRFPAKAPDATKLLRAAEDALTKICWLDDAQIVTQYVSKRFAPSRDKTGALFTITEEQ